MYLRHVFLTVMLVLGCASVQATEEGEEFERLLTIEFKRIYNNELIECQERRDSPEICQARIKDKVESLRSLAWVAYGGSWKNDPRMLAAFMSADTIREVRQVMKQHIEENR